MIGARARTLADAGRLWRFVSVGILGAAVDLPVSIGLAVSTTLPPELAKLIGAELAVIVMFVANDRWTYPDSETRGTIHGLRRLLKSNVVRGGGMVVQVTVVFLLTGTGIVLMVGGTDVWPALAMPIAIACGFVVNYSGETLLTWRAHR